MPDGTGSVPLVTAFISSESGSFLGGLLLVTVLAAILSTMDAALNAGAFTLTKDLLGKWGGPNPERRAVILARVSTAALALAAFLVASRFNDILKTLGLASKVMAEGLLIPGLAALFLKKKHPWAGLSSLACGGGYAVLCFLEEAGLGLAPSLPGLGRFRWGSASALPASWPGFSSSAFGGEAGQARGSTLFREIYRRLRGMEGKMKKSIVFFVLAAGLSVMGFAQTAAEHIEMGTILRPVRRSESP